MQVCSQTSYIASTVDLSSFSNLSHSSVRYVLLDTPGQIEVFTWSASGAIIMETLVCGPQQHIGYNLLLLQIYRFLLSHVTNSIQFVPADLQSCATNDFVIGFKIVGIFWHGVRPLDA